MSRIGKKPIPIPEKVTIDVNGDTVVVKGPNGTLNFSLPDHISVDINNETLTVLHDNDNKRAKQNWGMARTQIENLITGVTQGFTKYLDISGIGYRAQAQGDTLKLSVGHSHEDVYDVPDGISVKTPKPTEIEIVGIDCQKVGQVAAEIIAYRPSEPYKGKGINLRGRFIYRKEGKKK